jgi:hypothetical protein
MEGRIILALGIRAAKILSVSLRIPEEILNHRDL